MINKLKKDLKGMKEKAHAAEPRTRNRGLETQRGKSWATELKKSAVKKRLHSGPSLVSSDGPIPLFLGMFWHWQV